MNKVTYFRKRVMERYDNNELAGAAMAGEALLKEHANTQSCQGIAYADDLYNLARIYDEMSYSERATDLYVASARMIYAETGESAAFARRLNNLGALLNKTGRCEAAYRLMAHMSLILREALDKNDPELADGLYNLANAAADVGRDEEALRLHGEALEIRETAGTNEDVINSLHSIAFIHEEKDDRTQAVLYAETALTRAVGTDEYYSTCFYLAELYEADGQHKKAAPLYAETLRWIAQKAGRQHSAYIVAATRLAGVLTETGEYRKALSLQRVICAALKLKTGEHHLFYANCLRNMAHLHKRLGEPEEAALLMLKSIKIKIRVLGEQAREVLTDAVFIIDLYVNGGRMNEAMEMLVFVLMQMGAGHPDFENVLTALTDAYTRAGRTQFNAILQEMEKLNDPSRLWTIIQYWTEWTEQGQEE